MQEDDKADDAVRGGAENGGHGAELCGALGVADLAIGKSEHAVDEKVDQALQDEGEDEDGEEARDVGAYEVGDVGVPVSFEDVGEVIVGARRGGGHHSRMTYPGELLV